MRRADGEVAGPVIWRERLLLAATSLFKWRIDVARDAAIMTDRVLLEDVDVSSGANVWLRWMRQDACFSKMERIEDAVKRRPEDRRLRDCRYTYYMQYARVPYAEGWCSQLWVEGKLLTRIASKCIPDESLRIQLHNVEESAFHYSIGI